MPSPGAVCASPVAGRIPGSARAAAISARDRSLSVAAPGRWPASAVGTRAPSSIAATSAPADGASAGRTFLALVDVLRGLGGEDIGIDAHRRPREIAFLPGFGRVERRTRRRDAGDARREQEINASRATHV